MSRILSTLTPLSLLEHYKTTMEEGSDRKKGKVMYLNLGRSIVLASASATAVQFSIVSSDGLRIYKVLFRLKKRENIYVPKCECLQFDKFRSCKHVSAIALWFENEFPNGINISQDGFEAAINSDKEKTKSIASWQMEMKPFDLLKYLKYEVPYYVRSQKMIIPEEPSLKDFTLYLVGWLKTSFDSKIKYLGENRFEFYCKCHDPKPCEHLSLVVNHQRDGWIQNYLLRSQDFTTEKKQALINAGLPEDFYRKLGFEIDLKGKVNILENVQIINADNVAMFSKNLEYFSPKRSSTIKYDSVFRVAIVENNQNNRLLVPFFWKICQPQRGKLKMKYVILEAKDLSPEFWNLIPRALQEEYMAITILQETIGRMQIPIQSDQSMNKYTSEMLKLQMMAKCFWEYSCEKNEIILVTHPNSSNSSRSAISLKPYPGLARIEVYYQRYDRYGEVNFSLKYDDKEISGASLKEVVRGVYRDEEYVYLVSPEDHVSLSTFVPRQGQLILQDAIRDFETMVIPILGCRYKIHEVESVLLENTEKPKTVVRLSALNEKMVLLHLTFRYFNTEVNWNDNLPQLFLTNNQGQNGKIDRMMEHEKEQFNIFIKRFPDFRRQMNREMFYISFSEAQKNGNLLRAIQEWMAEDFEIHGQEQIKGLNLNSEKLKFQIVKGRDMGWFEVQVKASFGSIKVDLSKLSKAVTQQESFVLLSDGSMGYLPEEWIRKFKLFFSMSEKSKQDTLKINANHLMLLPQEENIFVDKDFLQIIREKQLQLENLDERVLLPPGKKLKAKLRSYQLEGFYWLQHMSHSGFGACLADDMGLGKTLQTICFIDYLLSTNKQGKVLVVCPTSLLFNWENELRKFSPHLEFHIHYGQNRELNQDMKARITLTSYGTLRNDIDEINKEEWLYVILDESQAIKNPNAQLTLAVQSVRSKNRLILSGTPIQNNTFDLWSQFNFINQGLLGNKTSFQENFANAIDKQRDGAASEHLRQLVKPFILRRTKEQVATDLPPRTESILWCELGVAQRKVYEEFREMYKIAIESAIEDTGIEKSSFLVLEGLLKLRQICDAPALLKKQEYHAIESSKLSELIREVEENTGNHKVLIFSQFTEMLSLISDQLNAKDISFSYLDGSTSSNQRKAEVEEFQENENRRVFLISLKAGGVGLNLTSADYVYLVDPWWNPAAEQQAIDRTHRIGQTKPVFSYKMICKDTIEEKILKLQEHKKGIAGDLIQTDASTFKKLSKLEIIKLFSN